MEGTQRLAKAYEAMTGEEMTEKENRIHIGNLGPGDVALLKQVAEEAAHKAVHHAFMVMGLDLDDPLASQKDFAILRDLSQKVTDPEFRADLAWVRSTRLRMEGIFGKAILAAVVIAVGGALQTFWSGVMTLIGRH